MDKLEIIKDFLPKQKALEIAEKVRELSDARFVDREYNNPITVQERCKVFTADMDCLPKDLVKELWDLAPKFPPTQLEGIQVNRYPKGGHIPEHTDRAGFTLMANLILGDTEDVFRWKDDKGLWHKVKDSLGSVMVLKGVSLVHKVEPVKDTRHIVSFFYV